MTEQNNMRKLKKKSIKFKHQKRIHKTHKNKLRQKRKLKIVKKAKVVKVIKKKKEKLPISIPPVIIPVPIPTVTVAPTPTKRRRKSGGKMYFTEETENAIISYNEMEDDRKEERETLYKDKIEYPFQKLVENVFNTFKFSYFETGPQDVQKETLSHLVSNMHKYKKDKGRAFAYFSIIAKHFLILLNNTNYKKFKQNVEIGEERDEHTIQLQHVDRHHSQGELYEFMKLMIEFWENNVHKIFTKQRDLNIANAVIELFRNSDRIDAFNKKALYFYIREISSCKTQQITKVINKMKQYHQSIQKSYINFGVVNTTSYIS